MPTSIFTRPKRQALATLQASYDEIPVATFSELLTAIGTIQRRAASGLLTAMGGGIVITQPMKVTTPIIIPPECPGLTIRAVSKFPITAAEAAMSTMFDVRAPVVTIRDMLVYGTSTAYFTTFVTIGDTVAGKLAPTNCSVLDNYVFVDRVFVEEGGNGDWAIVRGNFQSEINASHSASIVFASDEQRASQNNLADGGGDTITIAAGGTRAAIVGNNLGGGDYTSSASGGLNTLSANTNVGTVTAHATDDTAGGNTA